MERRRFIEVAGGTVAAACSGVSEGAQAARGHESRPNILVFILDHLTQRGVSAYGMRDNNTPAMDGLADAGSMLGRVYCNTPLCMPSRASFWTGRYPHETRVLTNGRQFTNGPLPADLPTLGEVFSGAGYTTVHFGKTHDFGTLRGFDVRTGGRRPSPEPPHPAWPENADTHRDNVTATQACAWLQETPRTPFLAVVDLNNPHNICGWVGANSSLDGPVENVMPPVELPALPANFEVRDWESLPRPVQYLCCSHNRLAQAARWTPENYRHYIAAYHHYCRVADRHVGEVLAALDASGQRDRTVVFVMADHGDGLASHRMVTKQVSFYEEMTRVPFVASGPGIVRRTGVEQRPLGSLLDLFPTLCDCAGIGPPAGLRGRSLMPWLRGDEAPIQPYVASEWHSEWGFTISPGRMIRGDRFKYVHYLEGHGEELYDLGADPGETRNLVPDPAMGTVLAAHRHLLKTHTEATGDNYFQLTPKVDPRWRSHTLGYPYHRGPTAPMAGG